VVTLRNLDIDGLGTGLNGIRFISTGGQLNVENCVIYGFTQVGIDIEPTGANPTRVTVKNTTVRNCGGGGALASPGSGGATVNISKSSLNSSSFGFKAVDAVKAVLDDCVMAGNTNNGVASAPASLPTKVTVSRCTINDNGAFGILSNTANSSVVISNNVVFNNATGIGAAGGGLMISIGNNNVKNNTTDTSGAPTSTPGGL
jgi:hypothetical protein